jgi:lipopolysaccharide transport system permease protein
MGIMATEKRKNSADNGWTLEIRPQKRLLDIDFREMWRYRDLYAMYVKRNIIVVYKQTVLGPLWFVVQPLFTTIMYMFVFGGLAGISTDGVPQSLFYMSGVMLWNYFNACFSMSSNVFVGNQNVFGKVYFPRLVVPLAGVTSNLIQLLIQFVLFVAFYLYWVVQDAPIHLQPSALLFPYLILLLAMHAMSWGLIISSMTTKYRDLTKLVAFGMQLFMYATPIIYPMSVAPEKYRTILFLNPLTSIFESFRYSVLGCGSFDGWGLIYSSVCMLVTLFLSIVVFCRVERNFMDTV